MRTVIVLMLGMMLMGCGKDKEKIVSVTIYNDTGFDLTSFIACASSSGNSWGESRIFPIEETGCEIIHGFWVDEELANIELPTGTYDLRGYDSDLDCYYKDNINVSKSNDKISFSLLDVSVGCRRGKLLIGIDD